MRKNATERTISIYNNKKIFLELGIDPSLNTLL